MGSTIRKIEYKNLEFQEKIGEGEFGFVNRVTLKKPYNGYKEAAAKTVFQAPAEEVVDIMSKLHHPHIVTLLGFCHTGHVDTGVIVMEFAPNGSLHDYLSDATKPLTYSLQRKWIKESAYAIQYLHGENILHKAIKAKNCLLFENNTLKLCDFGLMQGIVHSQKRAYQYMAPEIFQGNEEGGAIFSKPADIYGYGMLVLEIWTRKPPFDEMEWLKVVNEVCNGKQSDIPADCPAILSDMMKLCWDVNPKKRPTIESVLQAWEWTMVKEIRPEHPATARAACCHNGDIVAGGVRCEVLLLECDGKYKVKLTVPEQDQDKQIQTDYTSITISPQNHVMIVDLSRYVKVFDGNGKYLHCFNTITADENPTNAKVELSCIATDGVGQVLVGDRERNIITIHECPSGELVDRIKCNITLGNDMAVNSQKQILITSNHGSFPPIYALDYSGKVLFTITPTINGDLSDRVMRACGLVCDPSDNIYMSIKATALKGHIHRYSPTGIFQQCIDRGLFQPCDLCFTPNGSLMVANLKSILIYSAGL